jgi:hypothetical protein
MSHSKHSGHGGHSGVSVDRKRSYKRYNLPVIGHFADRSIRFNTILEAERITGISYTLIFESCIGKLHKARNVFWEFEKGNHFLRYKAHYMRLQQKVMEEEELKLKTKHHL